MCTTLTFAKATRRKYRQRVVVHLFTGESLDEQSKPLVNTKSTKKGRKQRKMGLLSLEAQGIIITVRTTIYLMALAIG